MRLAVKAKTRRLARGTDMTTRPYTFCPRWIPLPFMCGTQL